MSKQKEYGYWFIAIGLIVVSFLGHIAISSDRYFWLDEYFGLFSTIRKQSYFSLLASGARFQGSPVPLFYILGKYIDENRKILEYLGLPFSAYYRLLFNILFHISAIYYVALVWGKNKFQFKNKLSVFAFFIGLFAYLAVGAHVYFIDMFRPYILWNVLWFFASLHITVSIQKPSISFLYLTFLYALLALTATASIFQIAALFFADLIVRYLMKSPKQDMKLAFLKHGSALLLPAAISVYYLSFVPTYEYPIEYGGTWLHFMRALLRYLPAFVLLFLFAISVLIQHKTQKYLIYVLPSLFLLASTPVQMLLIQIKHYFVTSRQFLYFDLGYVFVALALVSILNTPKAQKTWQPEFLGSSNKRFTAFFQHSWGKPVVYFFANGAVFVLGLAGFFALVMALLPFAIGEKEFNINYNKYGPVRNTDILEKYISAYKNIPASMEFKKATNQDTQKDLEANAALFYEWLETMHPKNNNYIMSIKFSRKKLFIISIRPCRKCLGNHLRRN